MGDHQFGSFTQGIIDLLINTTGEFVTERMRRSLFLLCELGRSVYLLRGGEAITEYFLVKDIIAIREAHQNRHQHQ